MDLSPALEAWLQDFVQEQQDPDAVRTWVTSICEAIDNACPEVATDPVLRRGVTVAVAEHWRAFLAQATRPDPAFTLVPAAAGLAADLARRGFELPLLLQVYRVAQRAVWDSIGGLVVGSADTGGAEALRYFWTRASEWLDASVETSILIFTTERERARQGHNAQVLEAVREVLEGERPEPRQLAARLDGHPLSDRQTAVLLHAHTADAVADLREAAGRVVAALGARNPLLVSPGGKDLWCWVATRKAPELDGPDELETWLTGHRISAALGTAVPGVDGFVLSHQEARETQRILFAGSTPGHLGHYAEVELLVLLSARPDQARRFAERVLGPLAAADDNAARLRQTLSSYLTHGSVDGAARELVVHKNTVRYRMNQAEELLGRPVTSGTTELAAALRYHAAFLER